MGVELHKVKREGAAYSLLSVGAMVFITYYKYPIFKAHGAGIMAISGMAYVLGGLLGMEYGKKKIVEGLGKIDTDDEFEKRRKEILKSCQNL